MKTRTLALAGAVLLALGAIACSGSEGQKPTKDTSPNDATEESDVSTSEESEDSDSDPLSEPPGDPPPVEPVAADGGADAAAVIAPATPPTGGKCPDGKGVREVENNDTPAKATAMDDSFVFCGSFAGPRDADHFTFVMPEDATDFGWSAVVPKGNYTFTISSEGVTAGEGENAPWFPGKPYTIKLTSDAASDYVFTLRIPRAGK